MKLYNTSVSLFNPDHTILLDGETGLQIGIVERLSDTTFKTIKEGKICYFSRFLLACKHIELMTYSQAKIKKVNGNSQLTLNL